MKTDDLIRTIAQDAAASRPAVSLRLAVALACGGAAALGLFAVDLGTRPDIGSALQTWRFALKIAVMLLGFACATWAVIGLSRPDTRLRDVAPLLLAAPLMLAAGSIIELAMVPPGEWMARMMGSYGRTCLSSIPLLSVAPLVAVLVALRAGAPGSPSAAGAVAGGLAGALGAALYATHCPDDSPLFVALWYTLAVLPAVAVGAVVGGRWLRW